MTIERKISLKSKTSLIEEFEKNPATRENFRRVAEKYASELMADVITDAINGKKYLPQDVIEIAVAVSIGEPDEDNDEDETNTPQ